MKQVHEIPDRQDSVTLNDRRATLAAWMVIVVVVVVVMLAHDLVVVVVAIPMPLTVAPAMTVAMDPDDARADIDVLR